MISRHVPGTSELIPVTTGAAGALVDASRNGTLANPSKVLYLASFELFLRAYGLRPPGAAA